MTKDDNDNDNLLFPENGNRSTDEQDKTYENEHERDYSPMVQISLKEYDKLKEQQKFISDKTLIDIIDNIERLVRALRKHIVRTDIK
tara:strand:+ start:120 stop:380 length:261 start_codon:yes stop_codon:yes gene_type:complete